MRETHHNPTSAEGISAYDPGTSVVHVGPHKTGTTAVQGSLHAARERLPEHGVWLPSPARNPLDEVKEGVSPLPKGAERPAWNRLVEAFSQNGDRVGVLSSEFFADADDEACRRVVDDLGGESTRIIITLRPLAKIMPSQWQQHVQSGMSTRYEDWLTELLREAAPTYDSAGVVKGEDKDAKIFWHRHRHDEFVRRWADAAGAENVTVLVVDETEPDRLLRTFESLLGLPERTLSPAKNATNRSLTAGEIEAVRLCAELCQKRGWPKEDFLKYVRYGVVPRVKTNRQPPPEEAKIATPAWALERAAEIASEMAEHIAASGVRVIGDLDRLRGDDIKPAEPGEASLDPNVTALAIIGCMSVAIADQKKTTGPRETLRKVPLLRIVARRARRRWSRIRGRT